MGDKTGIAWTDATWNPLVGCTRVSEGCRNCYAERDAIRISGPGQKYEGVVKSTKDGLRWTGKVRLVEEALDIPLRWQRPRRIFVNSMSDLFHEKVSNDQIAAMFGVMAACPAHIFQVLTKRPERMRDWLAWILETADRPVALGRCGVELQAKIGIVGMGHRWRQIEENHWPLPNVWLGVSVEDQPTADERIPLLLQTPAAVRFVSYEPGLGSVDFDSEHKDGLHALGCGHEGGWRECKADFGGDERCNGLDWLIIGGESGPGARPFDLAWARGAIEQCRAAGVPTFVKQLGAMPFSWREELTTGWQIDGDLWRPTRLRDRKGADPAEWPEDLRVREFPRA